MAPAAQAPRILLLGAGRMGFALLSGWLARGLTEIAVLEPAPAPALARLAREGRVSLNPPERGTAPDIAVIAVKPQAFAQAVPALRERLAPATAVLSIAAGKTLDDLEALLGARALIRAMPNTPAAIGAGITVACAGSGVSASVKALAGRLLAVGGAVEWIADEGPMDAVTAVSGSGPAYVFHFVEALREAGVAAGLAPDLAARLARATVTGAGALLQARAQDDPGALRAEVTSPGGTTAAALDVLMARDGLKALMERAVAAAKARARALSKS